MSFGDFKGKSSKEFIGWMNRSKYHDMLSGFSDGDMLKVKDEDEYEEDEGEEDGEDLHPVNYDVEYYHQVPMSTRWMNDNVG